MLERWALAEIFGEPVEGVRLYPHSRFARLHGALATTRPDRIYTVLDERAFFADGRLALHEYFHVLRQWNTGQLTRTRYVLEFLRRGYFYNRFEVEARRFAAAHVDRYYELLGVQAPTSQSRT